jgi:hypothetical protein
MDSLSIILISGLVSLVTGTLSSLFVTWYRFRQKEEQRQSQKVEEWEEELEQELYDARQTIIWALSGVGPDRVVPNSYDGAPDEYVKQSDSPKLEKIDRIIRRIEKLSGKIPDKHSNLSYYLTEIRRQYRTPSGNEVNHLERWIYVKKFVEDARDKLQENKENSES